MMLFIESAHRADQCLCMAQKKGVKFQYCIMQKASFIQKKMTRKPSSMHVEVIIIFYRLDNISIFGVSKIALMVLFVF